MARYTISEYTRKIRKSLLAATLVGFAIAKIGVVVEEVSIFATKVSLQNYNAITWVIFAIVLYFLVTFVFYALSDYAESSAQSYEELFQWLSSGPDLPSAAQIESSAKKLAKEILELKDQLKGNQHLVYHDPDLAKIKDRLEKKQKQYTSLTYLHDVTEARSRSFLSRHRFVGPRVVVEFFVPLVLAVFVIGILFFSTLLQSLDSERTEKESSTKVTNQVELPAEKSISHSENK